MVTKFEAIGTSSTATSVDVEISALNGLLEMSTIVPLEADIARDIHARLHAALISFLKSGRLEDPTVQDHLLLGAGFKFIAENTSEDESPQLWDLLCSAATKLQAMPLFYRSLLTFIQTRKSTIDMDESRTSNLLN